MIFLLDEVLCVVVVVERFVLDVLWRDKVTVVLLEVMVLEEVEEVYAEDEEEEEEGICEVKEEER